MTTGAPTVLIANPSADVYGSDLQMLESISAMVSAGWRVVVTIPAGGALVERMRARGAEVQYLRFPVLRRANQSPLGFVGMVFAAVGALPSMSRAIRRAGATVVYVNTVTLPWWLLAARLARTPAVLHLHEVEAGDGGLVRRALMMPLRLARAVIVISEAALAAMLDTDPSLSTRAHLIYNGVPEPTPAPVEATRSVPLRLIVVARLSPRKAPHIALEVAARLRAEGYPVELELAGTPFPGYEWYEQELRDRSEQDDLRGAVLFSGYTSPIWPALARADIVLAPSVREPFGNAVVEAQLALRPVVATAALGHLETVADGETGLLVPVDDVEAMTAAVRRLADDSAFASLIASTARQRAIDRFSTSRYNREVVGLLASVAERRPG